MEKTSLTDVLGIKKPSLRAFDDIAGIRQAMFDSTLDAVKTGYPVENDRYRLQVADLKFSNPDPFSIEDQKKAILAGKSLSHTLKGKWELVDKATNAVVDSKPGTILHLPALTQRGTFINNGNEYTVANQMRLRAGVYARKKENDELEQHFNVAPGTGSQFRVFMEPGSGTIYMKTGQAKTPLYPIMKHMGVTDKELEGWWGADLVNENKAHDDFKHVKKVYQRMLGAKAVAADHEEIVAALREQFNKMKLDPDVTERTLGTRFENVTPQAILRASQKLLQIGRGEAETDDRDSLAFQSIHGLEDLFSERIRRDAGGVGKKLLWKATQAGNLKYIPSGALSQQIAAVLLTSGLAQPLEEINPLEVFDQINKVSRMGEGGIPSLDSIPDEARNVQPSYFGYVDPVRAPESEKIGVDSRVAFGARRGSDGQLYTKLKDVRTNKLVDVSAEQATAKTVAFPGELMRAAKEGRGVRAMQNGKLEMVSPDEVDFELPATSQMFSTVTSMVPLMSGAMANRVSMGSRMTLQALALREGESPLFQSEHPEGGSFEQQLGKYMGAVRADKDGIVVGTQGNKIITKNADGTKSTYELYHNFPFNRKSFIHSTPLVTAGQEVKAGSLIAKSNFTDNQGQAALGKNMYVAYMPYQGLTFEDAIVVSESAAKKLTSEHLYQQDLDLTEDPDIEVSNKGYRAIFASKYPKKMFEKYDEQGIIKPGAQIEHGEPLILALKRNKPQGKGVGIRMRSTYSDASVLWEHDAPGEITDVFNDGKVVRVAVKSYNVANIADKLCYSSDTEVLTSEGWKLVSDINGSELVYSLNPTTHIIEYSPVVAVHNYDHNDRMYSVDTTQVSLLVTDNHKLYAKPRCAENYSLISAKELFGRQYRMLKSGDWQGQSPDTIIIPGVLVKAGQYGNGYRTLPDVVFKTKSFLQVLGLYLSEGHSFATSKEYGIEITQRKQENVEIIKNILTEAGLHYRYDTGSGKFRIYSKVLYIYFSKFGKSYDKYIPEEVFNFSREDLKYLYDCLMLGDGCVTGTGHCYFTSSSRLADDFQRLCLHIGLSCNIKHKLASDCTVGCIRGRAIFAKHDRYMCYIYREKLMPEINHSHVKTQKAQTEAWVDYSGKVYCITLKKNHILYIRRKGKPVWCGNSSRYGNKGVIAKIVPDDQMIQDKDGNPFDAILNPLGIISRVNPSVLIETALGKIAKKTGKPYVMQSFKDQDDLQFALDELSKNGLSDTEDVFDPVMNRNIPNVFTGHQFIMKLHHSAEGKASGRSTGGYTMDEIPSREGQTGSKRVGNLEMNALISHGATETLRDIKTIRGVKNDEFWRAFRLGYPPPTPGVPFIYKKFLSMMQAGGINLDKRGSLINIMAMTDDDVKNISSGEIKSADTLDFDTLNPIQGGLFDVKLTGGNYGDKWTHYKLNEKFLNPIMEDPTRKLLGLTKQQFSDIIAGKKALNGKTGNDAFEEALSKFNVDAAINEAKEDIKHGSASRRDDAAKRLKYLTGIKKTGVTPDKWLLENVPIIPPAFRPVARAGKTQLVSDPNLLYKEMMLANENLIDYKKAGLDPGEARLNTYNAYKAVVGLGDPLQPKLQEKRVQGFLKHIFGDSPKNGLFQHKVLGSAVDTVGRAVVTPNPSLSMDQVGIPESKAWEIYKNFVVRNLVKRGAGAMEAAKAVVDKSPVAREALLNEMKSRPVIITRAPVLHKYGVLASWPVPVKGESMQLSPVVCQGFTADFDGDQCISNLLCQIPRQVVTDILVGELGYSQEFFDLRRITSMSFFKESVTGLNKDDFYAINLEDFPYDKSDLFGIKDHISFYGVRSGIKVIAYDEKAGKFVLADVHGWSEHKDCEVWLVNLKNGRQVITDDDERAVYGLKPNTLELTRSRPTDAIGMIVPVAKSTAALCNENETIKSVKGSGALKAEIPLNKNVGYVIGALIGDGWYDTRDNYGTPRPVAVNLAGIGKAVIAKYKSSLLDIFVQMPHIGHVIGTESYGRSEKHIISSTDYADLVAPLIGKGAKNKHLPPFWFKATRDFKIGLLSGLLDTDGSISVSNGKNKPQLMINFSSISIRLLQELQQLLLTLNIRSRITFGKKTSANNDYWTLNISSVDFYRIKDEINTAHEKNIVALNSCKPDETAPSYVKTDKIPITDEIIKKLMKKLASNEQCRGVYAALSRAKADYTISRGSARQAIELSDNIELPQEWLNIVNNDEVCWTVVESVENTGIKETGYDITVPGYETFMSADGVILSNTMNYHVPVSDSAVKEAVNKLMPSKNLLNPSEFDIQYAPMHNFLHGLYLSTRGKQSDKPVKFFENKAAVVSAFKRGEIDINDKVKILSGK